MKALREEKDHADSNQDDTIASFIGGTPAGHEGEDTLGPEQCSDRISYFCFVARNGTVDTDGCFNTTWELFIILLVIWNALYIPYVVGFRPVESDAMNAANIVIDVFFGLGKCLCA